MLHNDLSSFNTLALESTANSIVHFTETNQLDRIIAQANTYKHLFVLGGGSNVVFMPYVDRLVIKVETKGISVIEETGTYRIIEVQAGESWHDFVMHSIQQGWGGLENLALIPGTAGAAPVQNIGAYGVELDQFLHSIVAWDFKCQRMVELGVTECRFSYRNSMFKQAGHGHWLILSVRFKLLKQWLPVITYPDLRTDPYISKSGVMVRPIDIFNSVCRIRQAKLPDPAVQPNAGSFFKNPVVNAVTYKNILADNPGLVAFAQADGNYKLAAAWLIDQCGWKGKRMGPVGMHVNQALVMVNYGGASGQHVLALAEHIISQVQERFGVVLEPEPVCVR